MGRNREFLGGDNLFGVADGWWVAAGTTPTVGLSKPWPGDGAAVAAPPPLRNHKPTKIASTVSNNTSAG